MKKILLLMALVNFTFMNAQVMTSLDFEDGTFGTWTTVQNNPNETWTVQNVDAANNPENTSTKYGQILYDAALLAADEFIVSPSLDFTDVTEADFSFSWMMSYHWGVDPYNNYDITVQVSTDGGVTWNSIWDETMDTTFNSTDENYTFRTSVVSLDAYAGNSDVKVAVNYNGVDGAQAGVDDLQVINNTVASVNENILSSVSIYPNVTSDNFTVKNTSNIALISVTLFDINGRVVLKSNLNNSVVNVSNLSAGMYFVEINSADAKITRKLIKK